MKIIINEDLKGNDLADSVKPILEIDAFKPKIDEKNIVLTFYVDDENPAYDLSRFIEFLNQDILDTEVSSVPGSDGYYAVFVEIEPYKMVEKIHKIITAVGYLTGEKEWIFKGWNEKRRFSVK